MCVINGKAPTRCMSMCLNGLPCVRLLDTGREVRGGGVARGQDSEPAIRGLNLGLPLTSS